MVLPGAGWGGVQAYFAQAIVKLEGTPRAQTSVKAAHQSPHIFVTPETFGGSLTSVLIFFRPFIVAL